MKIVQISRLISLILHLWMAVQEKIALEFNETKVGDTFEVLIDSMNAEYYVGRTEYDSPEVDPEVLIDRKKCDVKLSPGDYCSVKITEALPFDLIGEVLWSHKN